MPRPMPFQDVPEEQRDGILFGVVGDFASGNKYAVVVHDPDDTEGENVINLVMPCEYTLYPLQVIVPEGFNIDGAVEVIATWVTEWITFSHQEVTEVMAATLDPEEGYPTQEGK